MFLTDSNILYSRGPSADSYYHSQYPQYQPTAGKEGDADMYYELINPKEEADQYYIQSLPAEQKTIFDDVDETQNMILDFPRHLLKHNAVKFMY